MIKSSPLPTVRIYKTISDRESSSSHFSKEQDFQKPEQNSAGHRKYLEVVIYIKGNHWKGAQILHLPYSLNLQIFTHTL